MLFAARSRITASASFSSSATNTVRGSRSSLIGCLRGRLRFRSAARLLAARPLVVERAFTLHEVRCNTTGTLEFRSVDRLSRNEVGEALQLFISILNSGASAVTREPRRTNSQDGINDIAARLVPLASKCP